MDTIQHSQFSIPNAESNDILGGLARVWHLVLSDNLTDRQNITLTKIETIASTFGVVKAWEDAKTAALTSLQNDPPKWHPDDEKRLQSTKMTLQRLCQLEGLNELRQIINLLKQDDRSSELATILGSGKSKLHERTIPQISQKTDETSLSAIENLAQAHRIFTLIDHKSCKIFLIKTLCKLAFGEDQLEETLKTLPALGEKKMKEAGKIGCKIKALSLVKSARTLLKQSHGREYAALLDWAGGEE